MINLAAAREKNISDLQRPPLLDDIKLFKRACEFLVPNPQLPMSGSALHEGKLRQCHQSYLGSGLGTTTYQFCD